MEPKGLSTIIATLLIVVITIAIFGFAWLFIYSNFFSRTSQTFDIIDSQGTTLTIKSTGTNFITRMWGYLDNDPIPIAVIPQINGLAAYWSFNEGSGNIAYDSSDNGRDGVLYSSPTWTSGKYGGALTFSGLPNQQVFSNFTNRFDNFTISTWVFTTVDQTPNEWNYFAFLFSKDSSSGYDSPIVEFGTWGNTIAFKVNDSTNAFDLYGAGSLTKNYWNHVVGTIGKNTLKLYVNGILVGSRNDFTTTPPWSNINNSIGGLNNRVFNGIIDEVSIYNRNISDSEVSQIFNGLVGPGLTAKVKILTLNPIASGKHTVRLCSLSQCNQFIIAL